MSDADGNAAVLATQFIPAGVNLDTLQFSSVILVHESLSLT